MLPLDSSDEWTAIAREAWQEAGLTDKIELRIGPALEALRMMPAAHMFDLAFIDADKSRYLDCLTEIIPRLRTGAVLLADNALWHGQVADQTNHDEITEAIRVFNDAVATDDRLDSMSCHWATGLPSPGGADERSPRPLAPVDKANQNYCVCSTLDDLEPI